MTRHPLPRGAAPPRCAVSLPRRRSCPLAGSASAADPLTVGVLLPGSRSDKGWMESAYDGLMAAQKEHGDKIKVQLIENVSYADWEQAFTALAQKNQLVIGAAGQVQTVEMKVAQALPEGQVLAHRRQQDGRDAGQLRRLRRQAGRDRLRCRRRRGMLSKNGAISYIGGIEVPPIVNAGTEFKNGAMSVNPKIKYFRELHRRLRRRRQVEGGDACRHRAGRRHPLPHPQPRPARHGAGREGKGHQHHRQLHRPLRDRSALRRLQRHRHRLHAAVRDRPGARGQVEAGLQGVRAGDGPAGFGHGGLQRARPSCRQKSTETEKAIREGKIKVLDRLMPAARRGAAVRSTASASASAPRRARRRLARDRRRRDPRPARRERRRQVDPVQRGLRRAPRRTPATMRWPARRSRRPARPRRLRAGVAMVHQHFSLVPT